MKTHDHHLPAAAADAHFDFKHEHGHDNIWSRIAAEAWTSDAQLLHAQMRQHFQQHHHKHHRRHHHDSAPETTASDDSMEFEPINRVSSWYDSDSTNESAPSAPSDFGYAPASDGGSAGPASDGGYSPTVPGDVLTDPRFTGTLNVGKPESFFMTQFGWPGWNPNGLDRSSDCGPTSLAMAALAFGKLRSDVDPDQLIVASRSAMGASTNRSKGTDSDQVATGARNLGLQANELQSTNLNDIDASLARGGMAIVSGDPINYERELGFQDGTNNKYADSGTYDGGHFILVVGKDKENYVVNDPACKLGPIELTPAQMQTYMNGQGGGGIVQVHP
jgi:hypothetical protein